MPQFNGKQEGFKAMQAKLASAKTLNLRCPRNGKTNELLPGPAPVWTLLSSLATERLEQAHGKAMKVVFVSPDTGQQGGGASSF